MAEPLQPDDHALFLAHLRQFPMAEACPTCRNRTWMVIGIESAVGHLNGERHLGAPSMPVVQVMCRVCFYVRSYAWLPIQRAAGRNV